MKGNRFRSQRQCSELCEPNGTKLSHLRHIVHASLILPCPTKKRGLDAYIHISIFFEFSRKSPLKNQIPIHKIPDDAAPNRMTTPKAISLTHTLSFSFSLTLRCSREARGISRLLLPSSLLPSIRLDFDAPDEPDHPILFHPLELVIAQRKKGKKKRAKKTDEKRSTKEGQYSGPASVYMYLRPHSNSMGTMHIRPEEGEKRRYDDWRNGTNE